ncbi:MAG: diguanylate cyclase [Candidatus Sedimenticola sp. 6PFRAG1]
MNSPADKLALQENAERLRLILPYMSQHKIPVTPENYAIWYHYVAGDNQQLSEKLDTLIEQKTEFTDSVNESLYKKHISEGNRERLEQVSNQLQAILKETSGSLSSTGSQAENYGKVLSELNDSIAHNETADPMSMLKQMLEESNHMRQSLDRMQQDFESKSSEMDDLRVELEQVRKQAITDPLTGLANRTAFFDAMDEAITATYDNPTPLCVIMFDIDHFKNVNDTHGHIIGDKVIRFVADTLHQSIKGKDTASRYGGEEFSVILPDTSPEGAQKLANHIRETIAGTNLVKTGSRESLGKITISGGVALYQAGEEPKEFIGRADEALYASKHGGRNMISLAG